MSKNFQEQLNTKLKSLIFDNVEDGWNNFRKTICKVADGVLKPVSIWQILQICTANLQILFQWRLLFRLRIGSLQILQPSTLLFLQDGRMAESAKWRLALSYVEISSQVFLSLWGWLFIT